MDTSFIRTDTMHNYYEEDVPIFHSDTVKPLKKDPLNIPLGSPTHLQIKDTSK